MTKLSMNFNYTTDQKKRNTQIHLIVLDFAYLCVALKCPTSLVFRIFLRAKKTKTEI